MMTIFKSMVAKMYEPEKLKNGLYSDVPTSKERAIANNSKEYDINNDDHCGECVDFLSGSRDGFRFYTKSGHCTNCAMMDAGDFYNIVRKGSLRIGFAIGAPVVNVEPIFELGVIGVSATGRDATRSRRLSRSGTEQAFQALQLLYDAQTLEIVPCDHWPEIAKTPSAARDNDAEFYVREECCSRCGAIGLRRAIDGKCHFCEMERTKLSPRQIALAAGKTWYTPTNACKRCNTLADRKVENGQCKQCFPVGEVDKRQTVDSQLMRETPDLVLSRDDARAMGFKVYRTGNACRKGHTGYRYVSTGNCIECLRG
jgi:hypothetical protein